MKFSGVMIGSEDPKKLGEFYKKVLGDPVWQDGDWWGFGDGGSLVIGSHSEVKGKNANPQRQIAVWECEDVKAEFERIAEVGAQVIAEPYTPQGGEDMWLGTFADPDGNYFQLSTPWKE